MLKRDHSLLEALANGNLSTKEEIEEKEKLLRQGFTITRERTPFDEPEEKQGREAAQEPAGAANDSAPDFHSYIPRELAIWVSAGETYNLLAPCIKERARLIEPIEEAKAYQAGISDMIEILMPDSPEEELGGDYVSMETMRLTLLYLLVEDYKQERKKARAEQQEK